MWWNKKKKQDQVSGGYRSRVSTGINKYLQACERKLAGFLNRKTQGLTTRGKHYFLLGFCLVFGGLSIYQFLKPMIGPPSNTPAVQPASIHVPAHIDKTGEDHPYPGALVTEEDMNKVREFHMYMDSLKKIPNGNAIYDSIMAARPHLMDTVLLLEQLYYQQKK